MELQKAIQITVTLYVTKLIARRWRERERKKNVRIALV